MHPHEGLTKRSAPSRPSTASTSTSARATSTASWAPTARARRRPCGCCWGWCWPRPGTAEVLGRTMPRGRVRGAAAGRGAGRVAGGVPAAVGPRQPAGARRARRRAACGPGGTRRRRARAGRARRCRRAAGGGVQPGDAAASRARPRAAGPADDGSSAGPRLLVLDEPTNGLDPQGIREIRRLLLDLNAAGTTIFLSSHLLAEVEQMATRVGVLDRGRLVVQEQLDVLKRPTGRTYVRTPDVARARALLDGQVESYDESSLLVRVPDVAALNAALVQGGCGSACWRPSSTRLEDVVLEATSAAGDRLERAALGSRRDARPAGRAAPAGAQPADLGDDPADRPAADDRGGAAGADRHRAAPRHRPGVPLGGAHRRHALPPGGDGDRAAAVPAHRGGGPGGRRDRGRGPAGHAALPARAARRPDPPAGGQAGQRDGVRAADPRGGRRDGVRRRGAAPRQRRHRPDHDRLGHRPHASSS